GPTDGNRPTTSREASEENSEGAWELGLRESGGRTSPVSRRIITTGILAVSAVAVVCVIFSLQDRDRRALIARASASLSAAQMEPIDQATPSREAISAAYKAALQNQSTPDQPTPTP